ncbi:MAG TPA: MiaB/RimO family radical SAM methylthiotransferase [Terracidiphilus sp.]|nr:MiaB/RimO family radical SAM methylthiotransferase [Terracidiphilus sp.]
MAGFHVENFGCRAARADGEALSGGLRAAGQHCVRRLSEADVVVVNTCSVTAEADRQARAFIRRAHRVNPAAKIVVTGCYAQRAPGEIAALDGVSAVIGNSHKALAPQITADQILANRFTRGGAESTSASAELVSVHTLLTGGAPIWADERFAHSFLEEAPLAPGVQTRPNLKIQEGCGNRCTFCVIPFTRGPSRSLPRAAVLRQVESFVGAGGNELVLSGINLGRWGRDLPGSGRDTLSALVREILEETHLPRLRLSSIEPMDWDSELIARMAEYGGARLARHAHLPLQSGSDAVLRRMHRRYRPWHYAEKVNALLCAGGEDLTLGADVMVGFPGETDGEFEETLAFVRALPFGYLHLFPFSPRPGTALQAAAPVEAAAVQERMAALRALIAEKSRAHRARFLGRALEAITLHTPAELNAPGRTLALTENFLPVEMEGSFPDNQLVRVLVSGFTAEGALRGAPA